MNNDQILWRRLGYMLSPQLDLYKSIAPRLRDKFVLEIGFCTGFGTVQYAYKAREVYAIEIDPGAVTFARNNLPLENVVWLERDILAGMSRKDGFDAALMIEVLEHIAEWRKALANVSEALVKGGKLYISARNANADLRRNELHDREWTALEFRTALSEFFSKVSLFDYTLRNEQNDDTRLTPLLGVCEK